MSCSDTIRLDPESWHRRLRALLETLWDEQPRDNQARRWARAARNCGIAAQRLQRMHAGRVVPGGIEATQIELNAARVKAARIRRRLQRAALDEQRLQALETAIDAAGLGDYGAVIEGVRRAIEVARD